MVRRMELQGTYGSAIHVPSRAHHRDANANADRDRDHRDHRDRDHARSNNHSMIGHSFGNINTGSDSFSPFSSPSGKGKGGSPFKSPVKRYSSATANTASNATGATRTHSQLQYQSQIHGQSQTQTPSQSNNKSLHFDLVDNASVAGGHSAIRTTGATAEATGVVVDHIPESVIQSQNQKSSSSSTGSYQLKTSSSQSGTRTGSASLRVRKSGVGGTKN